MNVSPRKKVFGCLLMIVGVTLSFLPLYAEIFTKKLVESSTVPDVSEGYNSMEGLYSFASTTTESYSMMHVSPWLPFIGGLVALIGGFFVGTSRMTKDYSMKNFAEQDASSDR